MNNASLALYVLLLAALVGTAGCPSSRQARQHPNILTPSPEIRADPVLSFPDRQTDTTKITAADGALVSIKTHTGYVVQLSIPPNAVATDTDVILRESQTPNPLATTAGPVFEIDSAAKRLLAPATIWIHSPRSDQKIETLRLFDISSSNRITPQPRQKAIGRSLRGTLRHFSVFAVGIPTTTQVAAEASALASDMSGTASSGIAAMQETMEVGEATMVLAEMASQNGGDSAANEIYQSLADGVDHSAEIVLAENAPTAPCGEYLSTLLSFGRLVGIYSVTGDVLARFKARAMDVLAKCPLAGSIEMKWMSQDYNGDAECPSARLEITANPAIRFTFAQTRSSAAGGSATYDGELLAVVKCSGSKIGHFRLLTTDDQKWTVQTKINYPFDVVVEFKASARHKSVSLLALLKDAPQEIVIVALQEQTPSKYEGIAMPFMDNGVVRGIGFHDVQVGQDETTLEFEYLDGARIEIPGEGISLSYILRLR